MCRRLSLSVRTAGMVLLLLSLAACGFHLRGAVVLPDFMHRTYIEGPHEVRLLLDDLAALTTSSGRRVVDNRQQATAILKVHYVLRDQRVLVYDSQGQGKQFELTYRAGFEVYRPNGESLLPRQEVSYSREMVFDDTNVLGSDLLEAQYYNDLRQEVGLSIMRRIQFAGARVEHEAARKAKTGSSNGNP